MYPNPATNPPLTPYTRRRGAWPWVVGGVVVTGLVIGGLLIARTARAAVVTPSVPKPDNGAKPDNGTKLPTNGLVPPVGPTTTVEDPVKGTRYLVPLVPTAGRASRIDLGLGPMAWNLFLGQRAGFVERWPTGAEMLWGYVRGVGPNRSYYDLEVAESIPYEGAYHDVRPTQLPEHQTPSGATVRVMPQQVIDAVV